METKPVYIYRRVGTQTFGSIVGKVVHEGAEPPRDYEFVRVGQFLNKPGEYEIYKLIEGVK